MQIQFHSYYTSQPVLASTPTLKKMDIFVNESFTVRMLPLMATNALLGRRQHLVLPSVQSINV